jgi:hypothetical protein
MPKRTLKHVVFAITSLITAHTVGSAHAAGGAVWSALPIDKVIEDLGQGVAWVVDQINQHNAQVRADSVGQLVNDLAMLSGKENALADIIDRVASNPQASHGGRPVMDTLNRGLEAVKLQFNMVQRDLADVDKQWGQKNAQLNVEFGDFAHDGALVYCINSCDDEYWRGQPAIQLTNPAEAAQLSATLRHDVLEIRRLAAALQAAAERYRR